MTYRSDGTIGWPSHPQTQFGCEFSDFNALVVYSSTEKQKSQSTQTPPVSCTPLFYSSRHASYYISPSNRLAHPAQIRFYTYPESPLYVACNTSPLAAFNIASSLFLCLLTSKLLSLSRRLLSFCSSSSRSSCNSTSVGSHGVAFVSSSSCCRIPASLRFLMSMAFSTRRGPEGVTGDEGEVVVEEVAAGWR